MHQSSSSRRRTLGPVSVNASAEKVFRGDTFNPSNAGQGKARPPPARVSMIPRVGRENVVPPTPPSTSVKQTGSTCRQSSAGIDRRQSLPPSSALSKTDPRNLSDKVFQQNSIKKLMSFLVDHGYDHPITTKSLVRPSGKDFHHIVTFLLRRIDPNFHDGSMKIEDEIAMSFKALGYPFSVSKTSLVAAGSPHAWPSLLSALAWLTERILCLERSDDDRSEGGSFESFEELEVKTDKAFFRYLSASYTAFLRGDEKITEQLEVSLAEQFERDDEVLEKEIEEMTDTNAVIVEQINNMTIGSQDLPQYLQKRDAYITDLAQFHDLINQMDNHVSMLRQKKSDKQSALEENTSKLSTVNANITGLKSSIHCQEMSTEVAKNLQSQLKCIAEAVDRFESSNKKKRSLVSQKTVDATELWNKVKELVQIFNALQKALMYPVAQIETPIPRLAILGENITSDAVSLSDDLESDIEKKIAALKGEIDSVTATSKRRFQEALDTLDQSEGVLAEANDNLIILQEKRISREEILENERQLNCTKCSVRMMEVEALESKVLALREPAILEGTMSQLETQSAELKSQRYKIRQDYGQLIKGIIEEIEGASAAIDEFEAFFSENIKTGQQYRLIIRSLEEELDGLSRLR